MYIPQYRNAPVHQNGIYHQNVMRQDVEQQDYIQMDQQDTQFDADAFEAAFLQASQSMIQEQPGSMKEAVIEEAPRIADEHIQEVSGPRIGSDLIEQSKPSVNPIRDNDELAKTAGQLLTSVQHDTSTKFQNSQFLNLMRRIRDREVEVQGEDFQETSGDQIRLAVPDGDIQDLHPGGQTYPYPYGSPKMSGALPQNIPDPDRVVHGKPIREMGGFAGAGA